MWTHVCRRIRRRQESCLILSTVNVQTCTHTSSKETGKLFNSEYCEQVQLTTCTRSNSRRLECGFMKSTVNVPTCTRSCLTKTGKLFHAKLFEDAHLQTQVTRDWKGFCTELCVPDYMYNWTFGKDLNEE